MKCPACSNEMIDAQATAFGETYKYCRNCKKELNELAPPVEASRPLDYSHVSVNQRPVCGRCQDPRCGPSYLCNPVPGNVAPSQKIARLAPIGTFFTGTNTYCFDNGERRIHVVGTGARFCACGDYDTDGKATRFGIPLVICFNRLRRGCACYECCQQTPNVPAGPNPAPGDQKLVKAMRFADLYSTSPKKLLEHAEKRLVGMSPALALDYGKLELRVMAAAAFDKCEHCLNTTGDVLYRLTKDARLCDWCDHG